MITLPGKYCFSLDQVKAAQLRAGFSAPGSHAFFVLLENYSRKCKAKNKICLTVKRYAAQCLSFWLNPEIRILQNFTSEFLQFQRFRKEVVLPSFADGFNLFSIEKTRIGYSLCILDAQLARPIGGKLSIEQQKGPGFNSGLSLSLLDKRHWID